MAAEAAFLVWIPQFVTVDAATHIGGAALLRDLLSGAGDLHLRYVQIASFPAPNLLPELAMGIVMLGVDPLTADKLLQVTYIVALPLALLYAVRGVRTESFWLAALALPMTFTFAFQYGFYDFSFGVVLFVVAAGYAWRDRAELRPRHSLVLGMLALLVYLTHIVAFLELLIFLATIAGWRVLAARQTDGTRGARGELRRMLPAGVAMLPSLLMAAAFFARTASGVPAHFHPLLVQLAGVLSLSLGLASINRLELGISALLALSLLVLSILALRARTMRPLREHDALLAFAVLSTLAAIVAPSDVQSGGSFIPERLTLFPVYGLALWLAASAFGPRTRWLAALTWVAIALAFFAVRLPTYQELSRDAQEYVSVAPCMAEGATLVQVNLSRVPSGSLSRTDPFTEETGRLAALTRGHDLGNFEGSFQFSLFRNLSTNDPFTYLATREGGFESVPPGVDLDAFASRPDGRVDYVVVVGRPSATLDTLTSPEWSRLSAQLARGYRLVATSSTGLIELYERMGTTVAEAGASRRAATGAADCH